MLMTYSLLSRMLTKFISSEENLRINPFLNSLTKLSRIIHLHFLMLSSKELMGLSQLQFTLKKLIMALALIIIQSAQNNIKLE